MDEIPEGLKEVLDLVRQRLRGVIHEVELSEDDNIPHRMNLTYRGNEIIVLHCPKSRMFEVYGVDEEPEEDDPKNAFWNEADCAQEAMLMLES